MAKLLYRWLNVGETISHEGRAYRVLARPVPGKWRNKVTIKVRDVADGTTTTITAPANAHAWRWGQLF